MNIRRQFELDIFNLSNKKHYYDFDIDEKFFASFEDTLLQKGNLKSNLTLDRSSTMIIADFQIQGTIELTCDRSLEDFDYTIDIQEQIIFKFGNDYAEVSDEIVMIPHNAQKLDVAQFIYEFIGLAVPMKKLHPRFESEEEIDEEEETLLIYSTGETEEDDEEVDETPSEKDIWKKLRNLKNNHN